VGASEDLQRGGPMLFSEDKFESLDFLLMWKMSSRFPIAREVSRRLNERQEENRKK
jgi:hypothetical protein